MLWCIIPTCGANGCFDDTLEALVQNYKACYGSLKNLVVVVVSNTDETSCMERVAANLHRWKWHGLDYRLYEEPRRIGYFRAIEWGWNLAEPQPDDYVVGLNDDVEISGDWITPLVEALDRHPNAQIGPYLPYLGADGFGYQTPGRGFYRYIDGCCWMARAETISRAGGIVDHGLKGAYCGDCDLSIRIVESGGILQQVPVPVRHIGHGTNGPETQENWAKNRQYLASKWDLVNGGSHGADGSAGLR